MRIITIAIVALTLGCSPQQPLDGRAGSRGLEGPAGAQGPMGPVGATGAPGPTDLIVGGSRLIPAYITYRGVDGSVYTSIYESMLHDTLLGIDCRPQLATDGSTRCLPIGGALDDMGKFLDSGCTVPGVLGVLERCYPSYKYRTNLIRLPEMCGWPLELYEVDYSEEYDSLWYMTGDGTCVAVKLGPTSVGYKLRMPAVPPSTFVEMTLDP